MRITRKVASGQEGSRKLHDQYGPQVVCARSRHDGEKRKRLKTIALIIEEAPWSSPSTQILGERLMGVRRALNEAELLRQVKLAGGRWNQPRQLWDLKYDQILALVLEARIEPQDVPNSRKAKLPNSGKDRLPTIR